MTWIKKIDKPLVAIVVLGVIIGFIGHNYVNYVEKQQPTVQISKGNDKTLVFYRDDCSDCQKIFHQVYWQGKLHNNILLINMNCILQVKSAEKCNDFLHSLAAHFLFYLVI